jgi:hypothetical protein
MRTQQSSKPDFNGSIAPVLNIKNTAWCETQRMIEAESSIQLRSDVLVRSLPTFPTFRVKLTFTAQTHHHVDRRAQRICGHHKPG